MTREEIDDLNPGNLIARVDPSDGLVTVYRVQDIRSGLMDLFTLDPVSPPGRPVSQTAEWLRSPSWKRDARRALMDRSNSLVTHLEAVRGQIAQLDKLEAA